MKKWVKVYVPKPSRDVVQWDDIILQYLLDNGISWRNPLQKDMPWRPLYFRYLLHITPEELVFFRLKFG
jgi:hypothetical protein